MSRELDDHRLYLSDRPRIEAYAKAIAVAVAPGDVVVDLGCGTGVLGLLACRAGARRVYAIDEGGMAEIAQAVAIANGFGDRISIVRGHSRDVSLPERADVVVADQTGHFGFEAGVLECFEDARRRFLRPGGRLVPARVRLWVAPIEAREIRDHVAFWTTAPHGFDMSPARDVALNSGHPCDVEPRSLLAAGRPAATLETGADNSSFAFTVEFGVERAGILHGVAGWFDAELAAGIWMTNAPGAADRINRRNVVFPIPDPIEVRPGETVAVAMRIRPYDLVVSWSVEHRRTPDASPARAALSTFAGMLISPGDLERTRPSFVPRLTERGRARQLVLDLADGRRKVADIERALYEAHPALFPDAAAAGRFVAEVITRYAE
jgi:protein arginine N-methyltransferase 1